MREYVLRSKKAETPESNEPKASSVVSRVSATGTDAFQFVSKGERAYLDIVTHESGREISEEVFERKRAERELLMAQSIHIADTLESVGVRAYGDTKLTMVGLISGIEEPLIDFRNIVFIPVIAKRKRNKVLGDLEYFLQNNPYSRMWVFTSGERCLIGEVADRIKEVHRRISKLNAKPFLKAAGISIVFRASELGSLSRIQGKATFHIHCHAIVQLTRKLSKESWSAVLGDVRKWWQHHFADAKQIQMARESCKYVVKPADLLELSGLELKELHGQLFKLHLVQALGSLKTQRREREETDMKFHRVNTPMGSRLETVPNWNTRPSKSLSPSGSEPKPDTVLATLAPAPYFSRISEPAAVVMNRGKEPLEKASARIERIRKILADSNYRQE